MKREFPFRARVNNTIVVVTGLHWSGGCYTTQGHGLVPLSVVPLEESLEPGGVRAPWAAVAPKPPKVWKRKGCFKAVPLTPQARKAKADRARTFLRKALAGPMPAVEVLALARKAGINEWSLRRAKKHLHVKAVKVGGKRQGWGAKWFWTAAQPGHLRD